ncbi:MAG TPA: hypothetical protein VFN52_03885 [Acidiferrobacteraceae bacterium]|nr:hypothetical protein [Acidiferrobacteraceae bacterium]
MKRALLAAALFTIAAANPVFADTLEATAGVSTLGEGLSFSAPLAPGMLNLVVGFNHYTGHRSGVYTDSSGDSIPYDADARLQSIPVLLNFFPFHGVFRITGGIVYNENQLDAIGDSSSGSYTFNGQTYSSAAVGTLSGNVRFRRYAPYLGIGFGDTLNSQGLSAGLDVGVLFQGSPQVSLQASNPTGNPTLAQDVADAQAQANQKASSYKYYPVIGLHLGYSF